jgi:acyl carrier protein
MPQIPSDLDHRVTELIASLCTVPVAQIAPTDRLREDLGLDSVSSMELLSLLAEELELDIEVEEAMGVTTVEGTLEMARRHLAAAATRKAV